MSLSRNEAYSSGLDDHIAEGPDDGIGLQGSRLSLGFRVELGFKAP